MYAKLIPKYRMLIYSGDSDACVPYWGTEQWVRELGFTEKKGWRQWTRSVIAKCCSGSRRSRSVLEQAVLNKYRDVASVVDVVVVVVVVRQSNVRGR